MPAKKKIVTIHIRKTDYTDLGHLNLGRADLSLPFSYYHNVIAKIHNGNNHYIFISDDPALIAGEFDYLKDKYISNDNAIVDFQHMLNADICIIANSTFSWWAAYFKFEARQNSILSTKFFRIQYTHGLSKIHLPR